MNVSMLAWMIIGDTSEPVIIATTPRSYVGKAFVKFRAADVVVVMLPWLLVGETSYSYMQTVVVPTPRSRTRSWRKSEPGWSFTG